VDEKSAAKKLAAGIFRGAFTRIMNFASS